MPTAKERGVNQYQCAQRGHIPVAIRCFVCSMYCTRFRSIDLSIDLSCRSLAHTHRRAHTGRRCREHRPQPLGPSFLEILEGNQVAVRAPRGHHPLRVVAVSAPIPVPVRHRREAAAAAAAPAVAAAAASLEGEVRRRHAVRVVSGLEGGRGAVLSSPPLRGGLLQGRTDGNTGVGGRDGGGDGGTQRLGVWWADLRAAAALSFRRRCVAVCCKAQQIETRRGGRTQGLGAHAARKERLI